MPRNSQPDPPTLFIDRALGNDIVADMLRDAGHKVLTLREYLGSEEAAQKCADVDWLDRIANRDDLIVLTKDRNLRKYPDERAALERGNHRVFVPGRKNASGEQFGEMYLTNINRIYQYARKRGPYVVRAEPEGRLKPVWP